MTEPEHNRRASDNPAAGWFWILLRKMDAVFQRAGLFICIAIATFSVFVAFYSVKNLQDESAERRDQMCRLFEGNHLADVERLARTYEFLDRTSKDQYGTLLIREIVRGMPTLEREARLDTAPAFCDEEGVGLAEPDPAVPIRRDFSALAKQP